PAVVVRWGWHSHAARRDGISALRGPWQACARRAGPWGEGSADVRGASRRSGCFVHGCQPAWLPAPAPRPLTLAEGAVRLRWVRVPVGPTGRILPFPILPGAPPKLIVFVQLEGADTASAGYLRGVPEGEMTSLSLVGAPCTVVFADEPKGDWSDFWFELID